MKKTLILIAAIAWLTSAAQQITPIKQLPQEEQPTKPTLTEALLTVSVVNLKDEPHVGDVITFVGKTNGKTFIGVTGDDGKFRMLVPKEETYNVKYKSFEKDSSYADLEIPPFDGYLNFDYTIKYDMPRVITLDNVYYDTGKSTLRSTSYQSLNNLAELLYYKKKMRIEVSGHTDDVGSDDTNQRLSKARANSVRSYLIKKGIAADRLTAVGYGESKPIAANDTPEGRQKNRRTEVRIL